MLVRLPRYLPRDIDLYATIEQNFAVETENISWLQRDANPKATFIRTIDGGDILVAMDFEAVLLIAKTAGGG